jgi:sugar/nucleoside kinase (ribokinase family)
LYAFGNVCIDDLVFHDGSTMWAVPGGGAVFAALGMALWSQSAAVIAPVGADYPRGAFARLDFSQARPLPHTMRNWGLYEADGTRHFLSRRDSLPWESFSSNASDVGAGPYRFCHLAPLPWERVTGLIAALRERGAERISVDLHDRVLATVPAEELTRGLDGVDLFFPSRQDVDVLYPGCAPLDALRALRRRFPRMPVIGVKCGEAGALVHAAGTGDVIAVPSAAAEVVDATGAGDAFCGGFLAGFARTGDAIEGALHGTVAAAFALAAAGPAALATVEPATAAARLGALRPRVRRLSLAPP